MKTKHLLSLIALAMLCTTNAWAATSYSITGTSPNKTLTITGSGDMTDFSESENAPWYVERSNIKTIIISDGITHVGAYAFRGITYSSITIPVSVESFGNRAFWGISSGSAKNVYYKGTPNEWAQIDFAMPASYASSHPFYQGSDDASYATNNHIFFYNQTTTETKIIVFTPGIEEIKPYVFWHAGNITNVNIPHSVTSIGAKAFWKCSSLCRIFVNNTTAPTVTTNVFEGMKSGTSASWIYLPSGASASTGAGGFKKLPWYDSSAAGKGASRIGYQGTDVSASAVGNNFSIANSKVYPTSGTVDGISWSLDADGVMTFSGSGAITTKFVTSTGNASLYPWHRFVDLIDKVVIKGGVTGLSNALETMTSLREIVIEQTTIPTASATLPTYIHCQKVNVYIDNSSTEDANLSSAPWNNSKLQKTYTTTFCNDPTGLTISPIGTTSAAASWTDESGDTWKYICQPTASAEPTSSDWASASSTNNTSVNLTNLTAGTKYTFYLISDCGSMTSNVINVDFRTECNIIASSALPWSFGFEGCTNEETPLCWGELKKAGSSNGYVEANTLAKKNGTYGLRIAGGRSNGSPKSEVIAIFPEFEENISNLELSFYYKTDIDIIDPEWGNTIYGKLQLGFVTTEGSFVAFGDPLPQKSTFTPKTEGIVMSGAPSGARFAILYTGGDELGYASIDDITVTEKPACNKPTGVAVTADSETAEGATITWNANGMSAWVMQVSEGDNASWGSDIPVATNSKVLTGLNAHTLYYVRVKATCGALGDSEWSDPVSFTTLCGTVSVNATTSWNMDFQDLSDNVIPECWDNTGSTTTSSWGDEYKWGTYSRLGNRMLRMDNAYLDGGIALINTPGITIPNDGRNYELTFDYSNQATSGNLIVKISEDGSSFTQKGSYAAAATAPANYPGNFISETISLADYNNKTIYIQFYAEPNDGTASDGAMFVDNVSVHKATTCFQPTALAASNLTANSAHMTWTAGASETAWRLQYRADGGSWSAEQSVSTTPEFDIESLSANTEYFVRVKAYCGVEDESEWSEVASFTTLCAAESMPFSESFSSASALPSCWEATPASGSYTWSAYEKSGAYSIQLRESSNGEATLKMPAVALSEAAALTFKWKNADGTLVDVYISTNGGTTKTLIPSDLATATGEEWVTKTIDLIDYTGETVLIYFTATFQTANHYAYIDDVEVIARPCDLLTNVTVAPTENGANIAWKGFVKKIRYKTGSNAWSYATPANNAGPHTLTGLISASGYRFCMLPQCKEEEEANWSDETWFTTKVVENVPYNNNFNSEETGDIPFGWSKQSTSSFPQISEDAFAYGGSGKSIRFESTNEQLLILPKFNMDLNLLTVSFDYRNRYCNLQFGYVEADGTTFTAIETLETLSGYSEKPYKKDLYQISNDAKYLAFKYTNTTDITALAFIDNMRVIETPECQEPTELYVRNLGPNYAHMYWSASLSGNEDQYQYIRVARGATPNWASATLLEEDARDVFLTGLAPNTEYDFYVRSYCRADAQGEPVKFEFHTACANLSNSYWMADFEMAVYGDMPSCWYDINGSDGIIYVDNNYGHNAAKSLHFAYHAGCSAQIAVLPRFTHALNKLRLTFWYKGNEGSAYEKIQVGYMTDPTDVSTFVAVGSEMAPTAAYQKAYISFDGISASARIAIRCAGASANGDIYIDDVYITQEEVFEDVADADDNQDRLEALMDQTLDITIKRPLLRNGDYCTLALPFNLSAEQIAEEDCPLHGFTIKEFERSESGTEVNIYLTEVSEIVAGKPYFVRYAGTPTNERLTPLNFRGVTVAAYQPVDEELSDDCTPYGVFNPYALTGGDQSTLFLSSNNTLYYPSANGTMNGFRAYIKVGSGSSLGAPIRNGAIIRIVEKENTATGVGEVQGDNVQCTKVLRDGQIIIIRDGKEYNVMGNQIR